MFQVARCAVLWASIPVIVMVLIKLTSIVHRIWFVLTEPTAVWHICWAIGFGIAGGGFDSHPGKTCVRTVVRYQNQFLQWACLYSALSMELLSSNPTINVSHFNLKNFLIFPLLLFRFSNGRTSWKCKSKYSSTIIWHYVTCLIVI